MSALRPSIPARQTYDSVSPPELGLLSSMKNLLDHFDYHIQCDDFFLYELGRLIEEDRASFDDEEFRRLIDAGIHEHIERRLEIRAEIAANLRQLRSMPGQLLRFVEDIETPLRDVPMI